MVREGRVFDSVNAKPVFGVGYTVVVLEPGAEVASASSGTTITVHPGHRIANDDFVIADLDTTTYRRVLTVTSTTVEVSANLPVAAGQHLVNLGSDAGSTGPDFQGSGATIYTDSGYANEALYSHVRAGSDGTYRYYHKGTERWELILGEAQDPLALILDTNEPSDTDQVRDSIRYAHLFADFGTGTQDDPWSLAGSNPVQAAIDDLPSAGGKVYMIPGYFDLGSDDPAVTIPILETATDRRGYIIEGAGQDVTFLIYSGTGSAFRYPQVNTGALGSSYQSNHCVFQGFAIQQTGTARTGNAFYMTYMSESLFSDLTVGTCRANQSGLLEPDNGFAYGIRLDGTPGDNVTDFNRIIRCTFGGNTMGLYLQNQGDNTLVSQCSFQPQQTVSDNQDGMQIHNSYGVTVSSSRFSFFGKASNNSNFGGLKLSGNYNGHSVLGCYFEANYPYSIYLNPSVTSPQVNSGGVNVIGNSISFTGISNAKGIQVGVNGGSAVFSGVNIHGNGFYNLTTGNTGIFYSDQVKNFFEGPNQFDNVVAGAGTDRAAQAGAQGLVFGASLTNSAGADNIVRPFLHLLDSTSENGRLYLENSSSSSGPSPRVQFKPGGSGSRLSVSLYGTANGELYVLNDGGSVKNVIDQSGNQTIYGNVYRSVTAAVTASTTHTQVGATALTADINNVSVCANADDAVKLPTAVAGMTVVVMNNGAQNLRIWPASGDNLGTGVDTVRGVLAAGSNVRFTAYDSVNWEEI